MDTTTDGPGAARELMARATGDVATRYTFVGVPRRFIHTYGTWAEIDADLGLDEQGIRRRLVAAV